MEINRRIKPRQTGKTQDLIEMAEILLSIGRKVVILFHNGNVHKSVKQQHKSFFTNKLYDGMILSGIARDLDFMRGHRVDCVLVDDFECMEVNIQQDIKMMSAVTQSVIYTTET